MKEFLSLKAWRKISPQRGFYELPKWHNVMKVSTQPSSIDPLKAGYGYGYFHYVHYGKNLQPQRAAIRSAAIRFAAIQIDMGLSHWAGMSLRRFITGTSEIRNREYMSYLSQLPVLTEEQEEGLDFEMIPAHPGRRSLFWICGLRRLERLGVLEIKEIDGEHFLLPTERFINDLKDGIETVNEIITRADKKS